MKTQTITVNRWIKEDNDELMPIIRKVIKENDKIHISAPVGTGKTTFAINVSEEYIRKGKVILMLFPNIAISEQVKIEFEKRKIKIDGEPISVSIYNSREKIDEIVYSEVILSTLDGAYKILANDALEDKELIIYLDETHSILQNAREDFQKSITAILGSKYPIIGFSATPSYWVNSSQFGIQKYININVTKIKTKNIIPIKVDSGLLRYVAEKFIKTTEKRWVVFMENKKDQKRMKELLLEYDQNLKVIILNADTKYDEQKNTWERLMSKGLLPKKYDIIIINSVTQSGINIKNTNIDRVVLVGQHDPFGFVQYIGRVRKYKKEYYYYFDNKGRTGKPNVSAIAIKGEIELQQFLFDTFKHYNKQWNLKKMLKLFPKTVTTDQDGNYQLNEPIIATEMYKSLKEITGERMIEIIVKHNYDYINFNQPIHVKGIVGLSPTVRKNKRLKQRQELVKEVKMYFPILHRLSIRIKETMTHVEVLKIINNADIINKAGHHFNKGKYYVKKKKDKVNLIKIILLAEKCGITIKMLFSAIAIYNQNGKNEEALKLYIEPGKCSVDGIYHSIKFFENVNSKLLKQYSQKEFGKHIGEYYYADNWKAIIDYEVYDEAKNEYTNYIYECFMRFDRKEEYDTDGKRSIYKELVGFNLTIDDYLEYKGIPKDFLPPTT